MQLQVAEKQIEVGGNDLAHAVYSIARRYIV